MNGILVINKDSKMTSHDVVNQIRKIFNTKKVGHLGTLDPLATGVLLVCLNEATKIGPFVDHLTKTYLATICLGKSSDTFDLEGNITEEVSIDKVDEKKVDEVLKNFQGSYLQTPPIFSAIKVNGKKLYEYARANEKVEIPKRNVEIYSIKRVSDFSYRNHCCYFDIEVAVSSGTYIRSLCYDIGQALQIPALMAYLCRTRVGKFRIDDAYKIDDVINQKYKLYNMLDLLDDYPIIDDNKFSILAKYGRKISLEIVKAKLGENPKRFIIKDNDKLIAIYELVNNIYRAVRVWN